MEVGPQRRLPFSSVSARFRATFRLWLDPSPKPQQLWSFGSPAGRPDSLGGAIVAADARRPARRAAQDERQFSSRRTDAHLGSVRAKLGAPLDARWRLHFRAGPPLRALVCGPFLRNLVCGPAARRGRPRSFRRNQLGASAGHLAAGRRPRDDRLHNGVERKVKLGGARLARAPPLPARLELGALPLELGAWSLAAHTVSCWASSGRPSGPG